MTKILITGIPGAGKTHIGKSLEDTKGFKHVDMEIQNAYLPGEFFNELIQTQDDVVMTWGFPASTKAINLINQLKSDGFKLIWFDGDREAAREEFIKRETAKNPATLADAIAALNAQMASIDSTQVISLINPIIVNSFNDDHTFRSEEDIIHEILQAQ